MIVYLGIGSNIDAENNIKKAKEAFSDSFQNARFSRTFVSKAVGFVGDDFHNLVVEIQWSNSLETLVQSIKNLEDDLGRVRGGEKFSSRHIDIDILLFGDLVCDTPIQLPRDEINENAYVLWPLAELAPDLFEPGGCHTYAQLWEEFDKSRQDLYPL